MHLAGVGDDTCAIYVGTTRPNDVPDFRYLRSQLSEDCSLDKEVSCRVGRPPAALSALYMKDS